MGLRVLAAMSGGVDSAVAAARAAEAGHEVTGLARVVGHEVAHGADDLLVLQHSLLRIELFAARVDGVLQRGHLLRGAVL